MASITSTQIITTKRSETENEHVFVFTLDTGDVVRDGPRFLPVGADVNAKATDVANRLIDQLAQQEIDQWLLT